MKYTIIGNGVAGTSAASAIRKLDGSGDINIISDETTPFYSRIRLIDYLSGEADEKDIIIYKKEWYEKNRINLLLNAYVSTIDKDNKQIHTSSGQKIEYDRLLIATGSHSFIPPLPGSDKRGVFTLRTLKDAQDIVSYLPNVKRAVLIGGGVLGLEAANSLRKRGHEVSIVEFFPRLLPRQMDPAGADILKSQLEQLGFKFYLNAKSKTINGDTAVKELVLEDNTIIDCDLIIISAGIRPNTEIAKKIGLPINKGLVVNDQMETELKNIYAAGDLIEHRGIFYGIWPSAQKQGEIAGINMAGGKALYEGTTISNMLKVVGIDLVAAGDIDPDNKYESVISKETDNYQYKKLIIKDSVIAGCILYGDITGYKKILKAIDEKINIKNIRTELTHWDFSKL